MGHSGVTKISWGIRQPWRPRSKYVPQGWVQPLPLAKVGVWKHKEGQTQENWRREWRVTEESVASSLPLPPVWTMAALGGRRESLKRLALSGGGVTKED